MSATTVERVLTEDKAASLAQRVWIRYLVVQTSGALVSRLYIKTWRVWILLLREMSYYNNKEEWADVA